MTGRSSFDVDEMNMAARKLLNAAASLREMADQLTGIRHGSITEPVAGRLHDLSEHSGQMTKDIGEQTDLAAVALFQAARVYQDLTDSIVMAFSGGE